VDFFFGKYQVFHSITTKLRICIMEMTDGGSMLMMGIFLLFIAVLSIVMIAGIWKTFVKAGKPGWASIVPIYNVIVMLEIAGLPLWMIIGFFIPFVNLFVYIWLFYNIVKRFGGGIGLTILMFLGIGWLILGFGSAQYNPNVA
jgi:hypothetical protein